MGRLIDADAWENKLKAIIVDEEAPGEVKDYAMLLISEISAEPTAFDVDKVVEELKEIQNRYCFMGYNMAIDVVKRGGIV